MKMEAETLKSKEILIKIFNSGQFYSYGRETNRIFFMTGPTLVEALAHNASWVRVPLMP